MLLASVMGDRIELRLSSSPVVMSVDMVSDADPWHAEIIATSHISREIDLLTIAHHS